MPTSTGADRPTAGGFTLIELLVGLAVFGMLLIGLNQGTKAGLRAWDAQARAVAARDQLDTADRALRLLIGGLLPPGGTDDAPLIGHADTLEIATVLPSAVALDTRLADVRFLVDDRHRLMMSWVPRRHEKRFDPDPEPRTDTELLSGVAKVQFSYRAARGNGGDGPQWQDDWSDAAVPALIKIHLEFAKGDPRHWPDIVVVPARDQPSE